MAESSAIFCSNRVQTSGKIRSYTNCTFNGLSIANNLYQTIRLETNKWNEEKNWPTTKRKRRKWKTLNLIGIHNCYVKANLIVQIDLPTSCWNWRSTTMFDSKGCKQTNKKMQTNRTRSHTHNKHARILWMK